MPANAGMPLRCCAGALGPAWLHSGLVCQAMHAIKTIIKATFLGAFFLGFLGLGVGGVAAAFIWPGSNLGPPVGAIYGVLLGILLGSVIGLVFGIVRSLKPRVAHGNPEKIERVH